MLLAVDPRALESEIFGLSSLRPLDGERAEKWRDVDSLDAAGEDNEEMELVEGLRTPACDNESRFFFPVRLFESEMDDCLGKRDELVGELRSDCLRPDLTAAPSSMTPNSFADGVGEELVKALRPPVCTLVRRFALDDEDGFGGDGEAAVEVRLDIRGILVRVSFVRLELVYANWSFRV